MYLKKYIMKISLIHIKNYLNNNEYKLLLYKYVFYNIGMTNVELSEKLNCSVKHLHRIEQNALNKLGFCDFNTFFDNIVADSDSYKKLQDAIYKASTDLPEPNKSFISFIYGFRNKQNRVLSNLELSSIEMQNIEMDYIKEVKKRMSFDEKIKVKKIV